MKYFILIFVLFFNVFEGFSQVSFTSSNGKLFFVADYQGREKDTIKEGKRIKIIPYYKNYIKIYENLSKRKIETFILKDAKNKQVIKKIKFSNNYENLFVELEYPKQIQIVNLRYGTFPKKYSQKKSALSSDGNLFVSIKKDSVVIFNANSLEKVKSYRFKKANLIEKVSFSYNNKYLFFCNKKQQINVLDIENNIWQKTLKGEKISLINKEKEFLVFEDKDKINIYNSLNNKYLKSIKQKLNIGAYKWYSNIKLSLNPDRTKACVTVFENSSDNQRFIVLDLKTGEMIFRASNLKTARDYYWLNNDEVFVKETEMLFHIYNLSDENKNRDLFFKFNLRDFKDKISDFQQIKTRTISTDKKWLVLTSEENHKKKLYIKRTKEDSEIHKIENVEFIAYTLNSKNILVKDENGNIGYLIIDEINKTSVKEKINIYWFDNQKLKKDNETVTLIKDIKKTEKEKLRTDLPPPSEWKYPRIKKFKDISKIKDEKIRIYAAGVEVGKVSRLNFHLLDTVGNFLQNAADKNIWCGISIKYPNGKVKELQKVEIEEFKNKTIKKKAIVLVLDHSGSMGTERAVTLQKGAIKLIEKKRQQDAMAVIKYDTDVNIEANLTKDKKQLVKQLKVNGLAGYGRHTALFDAIYEGIDILALAPEEYKKSVIVLTDGYENSSNISHKELINNAKRNLVPIQVIGYGHYVSKPLLASIAYNTGGNYFQIYNTSELDWICDDVYNKILNYYSLPIETPEAGKYVVHIKLCKNGKLQDELLIPFDNNLPNIANIPKEKTYGVPVGNIPVNERNIKLFQQETPMDTLKNLVSITPSNIDFLIRKEFEKIIFPNIKFVTNTITIIDGTDKELKDVIIFMKRHGKIRIEISGHTDSRGNNVYNQQLSERRALKVKNLMIEKGIKSSRIETVGYGEKKPLISNNSIYNMLKNRRVEFKILD